MRFVLASILITLALLGPVMSKSKHAVRQQQTQASYTFYQGMDSGGNDIKNVGGQSVDQLKEICNNEPRCVGFNTNGWVKHTLSPQAQWSRWSSNADQGFYVKNVNQPEYTFHQGMDSGGNDIKNVGGQSVDQLKEICNQEPRCVGFNTNGWVKHTLAPQSQWSRWSSNPNQGFYVKEARPQFDYTFHQGMDSGGNDIKNVGGQSVNQLKEICNQEPRCVAFNTNGWVKHTLSPQAQWSRWSNQANEGMYVKTPVVQYDYTFVQGMDSDGNDIKNVGGQTFDQLRDICNREPRCAGFNTNGWIKHTLKPQSQWNRWSSNPTQGFYVRNDRYTFVQGMDSDGNDIKNVGGQTVEQLKDICSKDPRCVGFNTNGWIKHTLKPQSQWNRWSSNPNQGFYVRQTRPNSVSLVQKGSSKKQKVLHA